MPYINNTDTIFAPATVPGTGAITIVRISGPKAIEVADRVVTLGAAADGGKTDEHNAEKSTREQNLAARTTRLTDAKGYTIHFGTVSLPSGELLDEVLVSVFRAPHSYTGEDSVEISCHASTYIISELSTLLVKAGARAAEAGEFTKRAFLAGKMDLSQAEAVADVIASQNAAAHRIAISQMKGGISAELKRIRTELLEIASLVELELDFSEEDVQFADREKLDLLLSTAAEHISNLAQSFRLGNAIKNGVPVAIVGATNVGKSTLLNTIVGEERAIVTDIHGTTRDTIEETVNIDGIMFRFIDTAGLRDSSETVEKIGIERTRAKVTEAEVVLGLIDGSLPENEMKAQAKLIVSLAQKDGNQELYFIVNKSDLLTADNIPDKAGISPEEAETHRCNKKVSKKNFFVLLTKNQNITPCFISAKNGDGVDELLHDISAKYKGKIANAEAVTITNLRHFEALRNAESELKNAREALAENIPTDLLADDIRNAISVLGEIVGEITTTDILSSIFANFCIGK